MIAKLNITVAVKGENPKIIERQLLTHEQLLILFTEEYEWIQHNVATYGTWDVILGWNPITKKFTLYSCVPEGSSIIELMKLTIDKISIPDLPHWVQNMLYHLWDREFPLHVKMKELQDKSQVCGELLEWLQETKDIHFAQYHEHTDACYDEDECPPMYEGQKAPYCGCYEETLYPINIPLLDLLHEFFGVDRKEFNAEKERMLEEVRS
jgi:hypothetical protein